MSSTTSAVERLAQPITFPVSGRIAPNRLLNAAMSECLASWTEDPEECGIPTPTYINLYKVWGEGGWGQVLTGNVQVDLHHIEGKGNAMIPLDASFSGPRFEAFKKTADGGKAKGNLIVAQLSHAGRQVPASITPNPISASDVQLIAPHMGAEYGKPRAATQTEIDTIVESFAHAAEYCEKAGFDGVQIHGAHGYLVAQFLSPTTNKRTDQYGGSVVNRARLAVQIADAIRSRTSSKFILGIKINSVEFQDDGITPEDAAELCRVLEGAGFDYFELSGGTYEKLAFTHKRESTKKREAFFLEFAETIMKAQPNTGKAPTVYITGGFRSIEGMANALDVVDGVGLGKAAAADPAIADKLLRGEADCVPATSIPDDNFTVGLLCASAQLRQIGEGESPINLNVEENWQAIMKKIMESQSQ